MHQYILQHLHFMYIKYKLYLLNTIHHYMQLVLYQLNYMHLLKYQYKKMHNLMMKLKLKNIHSYMS